MAGPEEIAKLTTEVGKLSETIIGATNTTIKNQVVFKEFLKGQREELSASIDSAADKLDKSSKASFWLTGAIALFAFVEAGSIFYDVVISKSDHSTTDCAAVAESVLGEAGEQRLSRHERRIAASLSEKGAKAGYISVFKACENIAGNR